MIENWKDIPGFEGLYQVSDMGRLRAPARQVRYTHWRTQQECFRLRSERLLSPGSHRGGYLTAHLYKDGALTRATTIHRLVVEVFLGLTDPSLEVNHLDGNKKNNVLSNLEIVSSAENKNHAVETGLNKQAKAVRGYPSMSRAARDLRVSPKTLRKEMRHA